jgi:hypothetical protein
MRSRVLKCPFLKAGCREKHSFVRADISQLSFKHHHVFSLDRPSLMFAFYENDYSCSAEYVDLGQYVNLVLAPGTRDSTEVFGLQMLAATLTKSSKPGEDSFFKFGGR